MIIALQGKRDIMGKLVFGKNGQVHFNNENEKQEAIEYLLTSDNVDFDVHEDNQEQGCKFRFIGSPIPLATDQCFRL